MSNELKELDKQIKNLKFIVTILTVACIASIGVNIFYTPDIITAKGIVLVDDEGRDRVLMGAPIPKSNYRVRNDIEKAKTEWPELELDKESDWFEEMNHDAFGLLVIDENGHDRVSIGSPVPDPNIGLRIGDLTGVSIHNRKGFERSGYGHMLNDTLNVNRVVLGLDHDSSSEGVIMAILENGMSGFRIFNQDYSKQLFLGNHKSNPLKNDSTEFIGLTVKKGGKIKDYN